MHVASGAAIVREGEAATLSATATGNPAPTLQWERLLPGSATWAPVPGAVASTLVTLPLGRADDALRNIPIILITARDDPNVATTGWEAGADRTLRKPADAESILAAIQEVRGETSGPPPG